MTKSFLKATVLSAVCAMLSAPGLAQSPSQAGQPSPNPAAKSWSTKRLSATGRVNDNSIRASKLVGAHINDSTGNRAGQIQDIIVNPASGRIDFALISLNTPPENNLSNPHPPDNAVPVPWSLLKTSASSQYATESEQPLFTLNNVDMKKLKGAPAVDSANMGESEWRQRIYSYYGVTPAGTPASSMGAAESPGGVIKGQPARRLEEPTNPQEAPPPNQ